MSQTPPTEKTEKRANLSLLIVCPDCGETAETFPLAEGKTAEMKYECSGWCEHTLTVPPIWVRN